MIVMLAWLAWPAFGQVITKIPSKSVAFTPDAGSEWTDPDPTEVDAALEAVVERVVTLEGGGGGEVNNLEVVDPPNVTDHEVYMGDAVGGTWKVVPD